tara:strand:- start:47 stop:511 length:465 start_codon:yes stop_codon:yes gene_type:complete
MKNLKQQVENLQKKWADYIISIGVAYFQQQDFNSLTRKFVDELYAFDYCNVLFKPTIANKVKFRDKKEEFISYFLGNNNICKEDKGFALRPWKSIKFKNFGTIENREIILVMGNYVFKDFKNITVDAEFTFGLLKINNKLLKICLQHSSLSKKK